MRGTDELKRILAVSAHPAGHEALRIVGRDGQRIRFSLTGYQTVGGAMVIFGVYIRELAIGDLVWLTSDRRLTPGPYRLGASGRGQAEVYFAEGIAAFLIALSLRLMSGAGKLPQ